MYVAVEEHLLVDSNLIKGTYPYPMSIPPPSAFYYDGTTASSSGLPSSIDEGYYPEVNDSFQVLYGTTSKRSIAPNAVRSGLLIKGVYNLPYAGESGFTIQNIARDGTIFANYGNASVTLKPGEEWVSPVTTEISKGNGSFAGASYAYTTIINTTWTVTNLGVYDKANLTRYRNNQSDTGYYRSY
ncbi:hypothetical protein [Methanocella arvoryzae]|nr:hypothetical protein [Methanocella arvoryzae]